ncbi:MAG: transcriptional regulator [Planctomycetota bacterium]
MRRGRPPGPHALYRRLAKRLREGLATGRWPTGTVWPSLRALAREHRAGPITIRAAVEILQAEGWLEKQPGGRLLVRDRNGIQSATHRLIVEVVSGFLDHQLRTRYGKQIQDGLTLEVANQGRALLLAHHWRFTYAAPASFENLQAHGVLLWGHFVREALRAFERMEMPVVFVDRPPEAWNMHSACVDNEAAAEEATRKLIEYGHRRIAFIRQIAVHARHTDPDTIERQRGYERALRTAGLSPKKEWIVNSLSNDTPASPAFRTLLSGARRPTAVLAVDAQKAVLVLEAARQGGLHTPRQLSVACFQEKDPEHPELSGPRVDFTELARQAALLLKEPKRPPQIRRIPAVWAEGQSIARPGD